MDAIEKVLGKISENRGYIYLIALVIILLALFSRNASGIEWQTHPPIQPINQSLGVVLGDIESHMPRGHQYRSRDKRTWAHETTHGIHSLLRQRNGGTGKVNCFYVGRNRYITFNEPKGTLADVSRMVPVSLRGEHTYSLYMVRQREHWNNEPLYVCDEWVAYANGAATGIDIKDTSYPSDTLFALHFTVYAWTMVVNCQIDDPRFIEFAKWHTERVMRLAKLAGMREAHNAYLHTFQTAPDAENIRGWIRYHGGREWTNRVLGF